MPRRERIRRLRVMMISAPYDAKTRMRRKQRRTALRASTTSTEAHVEDTNSDSSYKEDLMRQFVAIYADAPRHALLSRK